MTLTTVKHPNRCTINLFQKIATLGAILIFCAGVGPAEARESGNDWEKRLKFQQVSPSLYRGKEPKAHEYQYLADQGIKTIINLRLSPRSARRSQQNAAAHGMKSVNIPIGFFIRPYKEIHQFLSLATDPAHQPVYIFCQGGRDRVGLMVHAYRIRVEGWSYEMAYRELKEHEFRRWLLTLWNTAKEMKEDPQLSHKHLPARVVRRNGEPLPRR